MNVFEQHDVKPGDYVEFTVTTDATYKYDGVIVDSVHQNTYKGKFDRMESGRIILEGAFPLTVTGEVTLNVVKRADRPREIGWYEVDVQTLRSAWDRGARYWNGFGWSTSPNGRGLQIEFSNIRFIGK